MGAVFVYMVELSAHPNIPTPINAKAPQSAIDHFRISATVLLPGTFFSGFHLRAAGKNELPVFVA